MRRKTGLLVALAVFLAVPGRAAPPRGADGFVAWVRVEALMPQWGFYPVGAGEEGRAAFSQSSRRLTWVLDLPREAVYHVWVRKSLGGVAGVQFNEKPLADARGGPRGSGLDDYTWRHQGSAAAGPGPCHVDILVSAATCRLAAVLITSEEAYDPSTDPLPIAAASAVTRAPRTWRDDSHLGPPAGERGFVTGTGLPLYEEVFHDWVPAPEEVDRPVRMWGAANQYINGTFGIRALADIGRMEISLAALAGPGGREIGAAGIDLRVVHVREREISLYRWSPTVGPVAELLLRDNRTGIPPSGPQGGYGGGACVLAVPAGESRQVWLTVHVPAGYPPGLYRGRLRLSAGAGEPYHLPVELEVLPMALRDVTGRYAFYYRFDPVNEGSRHYVPEERYLAELKDMRRHGLNTVTLYAGFDTIRLAREAGLKEAPLLMSHPGRDALRQIEEAREMGFPGLVWHGFDEPSGARIEETRRLVERRRRLGVEDTFMAMNRAAWEQLSDVVNNPVLILYHFSGRKNPLVMEARERGFYPVSYWMADCPFPLWNRSFAGLYNTACGFLGTIPWAYNDHVEALRQYDPLRTGHGVTYPDENGYPIPTLQWAAYRAGIDDVRYLQALETLLEKGREMLRDGNAPAGLAEALASAEDVYGKRFESIGGAWHRYTIRARMEELEETRREFAEAAIALEKLVAR